jgi:putative phosphoesterase
VILGIISDVHANVIALEAVLAELKAQGADRIVCLGDLIGYGPAPNETIELLRQSNVLCTLGAADEQIAFDFARRRISRKGVADEILKWTKEVIEQKHVHYLQTLPVQRRLETPIGRLRFFHGTAEDPSERLDLQQDPISLTRLLEYHRCKILACGGSHVPYYRKLHSGWVVNPGSVGLSLNGEPGADYALLTIRDGAVEITMDKVEYDFGAVAFDIVAWGLPPMVAEAIQMGRMPDRPDGSKENREV